MNSLCLGPFEDRWHSSFFILRPPNGLSSWTTFEDWMDYFIQRASTRMLPVLWNLDPMTGLCLFCTQFAAQRVKERIVGLRARCSTAALMPFNPVVDRKVVSSTLRLIRNAAGKGGPGLKRGFQKQVGGVCSMLNHEGQSDDLKGFPNKTVRGTASEANCVSGETTSRMEEFGEQTPRARSKLDENVARLEGKSESRNSTGRLEYDMDKAENQNPPRKLDDILGKPESQNASRMLNEKMEPVEELPGPDSSEAKPEKAEKVELRSVENEGNSESVSPEQPQQRKVGEKTGTCIPGKEGSGHAGCVIQLASKGSTEANYVEKLKSGDGLQLPDGAVVTTAAESTLTSVREAFDVNAYLENLPTSQLGRLVLYSTLIPSTHTLLSQNFHSFPAGTICIAGAQLQGKGRGGNVWQSPKGCLMFSFTTQMTNGRMVPFLQYVVSLAVTEAVEETCKASGIPTPDVRIKWPNDLYAKGLKIGGVLCTSTYRAKTFNIVVGVGLNVGNREPTTCLDALIEDLCGGSTSIEQELLLATIMSRFEILNKIFQDQGFLPLQEAYYRKWLHSGQSVVLEEREPGSSTISYVAVTIQGLTPAGYLLASDDRGELYELHPDGNSFDFLKGLVRQKLAV